MTLALWDSRMRRNGKVPSVRPTATGFKPWLEALEDRCLLSGGNVAVALSRGGDLIVRGDSAANEFAIVETESGIVVTGQGETTINGGDSAAFAGVTRDIRITSGSGDDVVHLFGVDVPRNLIVNGGTGADYLSTDEMTVGGRDSVRGVESRGDDLRGAEAVLAAVQEADGAIAGVVQGGLDVMQLKLNQAIQILSTPNRPEQIYLDAIDQGMETLFMSNLVILPTQGDTEANAFFDVFLTMSTQFTQSLDKHVDGVGPTNRTVAGLGTPASKAAAFEARNFLNVTREAMQVIGQQTNACDPSDRITGNGCQFLQANDEGGNVVDTVLGQFFSREVRSPFPVIFSSGSVIPDEQVILTDPLRPGECAAVVKEIQGIKVVVTPRLIPIWVEPWFARARIVGFRTVWTWEFVPAEFIKTISVCNVNGTVTTNVSTQVVLERELMHFWRFFHKDVTAVAG